MRHFIFILAAVFGGVPALYADQQQWVGKDAADRAAELMPLDTEIRHFCEPCDDPSWTPETVSSIEVRPTGSDDTYEVLVNGNSIDLAYVYIEHEGQWVNLATHLGLEVSAVSEALPSGAADFGQTWFLGTVGDKAIFMELIKSGAEVGGTYSYAHVGLPIEINGTINDDGALALTEFAGGKRTGLFVGKFDLPNGSWTGKWLSPDGSRELAFAVWRIAILVEESRSVLAGAQDLEATLTMPLFIEKGAPQTEAVNFAVRGAVEEAWYSSVSDWASQVEYLVNEPQEEDYTPIPHSLDIVPGIIYHYSPTLVSLTCLISTYSGGAHGMSWTMAHNLVIDGGKTKDLGLADLFKPDSGYLAALSGYCIEDLKKKEASSIVDGGITEFTEEQLSSFAISRAGLTVFFAPYAVASYAEGPFEVSVPWDIIAPMLRDEIAEKLATVPALPAPAPEEEAKG